jgi:hypothetical protein
MLEALAHYGLGPDFVDLIQRLYWDCKSDIFLNQSCSSTFPICQGVRQGDTLSPLLFILTINPLLNWISRGNTRHQFTNGLTTPITAYCNNFALVGHKAEDLEEAMSKLVRFGAWAGLEVNANKSAHTNTRASHNTMLQVPYTASATGLEAIPLIPQSTCYQYMGVALNLDLNWSTQMAQTKNQVKKYLSLITHRHISTANQVYISNMVINALVGYSMCVVQYPHTWLHKVQSSIVAVLKRSMHIPANLDIEPFLMAPGEGGRGLVSLVDLQNATLCACTIQEVTSLALSA